MRKDPAMPHMLDDPADMTPSQRRREIGAILARGVLRLRQCARTSPGSGEFRTVEKGSRFLQGTDGWGIASVDEERG